MNGADEPLVIPYGCARWEPRWISRDGGKLACAVPHVAVARGRTLRLQYGQYAFQEPPPLIGLRGAAAQRDFVRDYLVSRCDPWASAQARFVEAYFAFVAGRIEAERDALSERIAPFGSLFDYRDWMFAAPRPLPRAWLATEAGSYDAETMVGVDVAFWTADGPIALDFAAGTPPQSRRAALDRLEAAGATLIRLPAAFEDAVFETAFPPLFARFWEGLAFPSGPFKARGIEAFR